MRGRPRCPLTVPYGAGLTGACGRLGDVAAATETGSTVDTCSVGARTSSFSILRPDRDSSSTTSNRARAGQPATIRAPMDGCAAAMLAATEATMPAANASRAD